MSPPGARSHNFFVRSLLLLLIATQLPFCCCADQELPCSSEDTCELWKLNETYRCLKRDTITINSQTVKMERGYTEISGEFVALTHDENKDKCSGYIVTDYSDDCLKCGQTIQISNGLAPLPNQFFITGTATPPCKFRTKFMRVLFKIDDLKTDDDWMNTESVEKCVCTRISNKTCFNSRMFPTLFALLAVFAGICFIITAFGVYFRRQKADDMKRPRWW